MNKYLKKTFEYIAGSAFNKFLLLLLLPIFTCYLAPEEYAIYANILIFISILSLIYVLGMEQAIFSYFYHKKTREYQFKLISTIYFTICFIGLLLSIIIIIFRNEISFLILKNSNYSELFVFTAFIIYFDALYAITLSFFNILEKSMSYVVIGIIKNLLFLLLIILSIVYHFFSIRNIFIFLLSSSFTSAFIGLFALSKLLKSFSIAKEKRKYFSFSLIKKLLLFGLIMIPGTLAMLLLKGIDRYMITYLSPNSLYDVGIYAVGYKIGMIVAFLNAIVSLVYFPLAMKMKDTPDARKTHGTIFQNYLIIGGFLSISLILFSREMFILLIGNKYFDAFKIVIFGVLSYYLLGVFNIINIGFYIRKKAFNITMAVILGALLNIGLNYILIPKYTIYGAGIASVLAYFFIVLLNYFIVEKKFYVGYNLLKITPIIIIILLFSFLNLYIVSGLFILILKIFIFIFLLFYLYFYYIKKENVKNLKQAFLYK